MNRLAGLDCPKCGAPLATDGRALWCTFVANGRNLGDGRNGIYDSPCDYGIAERVPLVAHEARHGGDGGPGRTDRA